MKTLKQWYNHKVKYPSSSSFYTVSIKIGGNAKSKKDLRNDINEILPGLQIYLLDKGFVMVNQLKDSEHNDI